MFQEPIIRIGLGSAREGRGQMLLELQRRLKAANVRINVDFLLPLTSTHVAHVLGLPVVHVSRTISAMNRSNLIGESYGAIQTLDRQRLMRLSQFDGDYLQNRLNSIFDSGFKNDITSTVDR